MLNKTLLLCLSLSLFFCTLEAKQNNVQLQEQAKNRVYNKTIRSFMQNNKKITTLVNKSYAYAVFPSVGKGGVVFGGAHGEGRVFRRGMWVANTTMTQYTFGLQVGGQVYSEMIFFMSRDAFKAFQKGGYTSSTQSSFVPFYSGLSGDVNFAKDVYVVTSSGGGFMVEASTGTQEFTYKSLE